MNIEYKAERKKFNKHRHFPLNQKFVEQFFFSGVTLKVFFFSGDFYVQKEQQQTKKQQQQNGIFMCKLFDRHVLNIGCSCIKQHPEKQCIFHSIFSQNSYNKSRQPLKCHLHILKMPVN